MIRRADELTKLSQDRLREVVTIARGRGISWQSIDESLGVSRQAAFKRFGTTSEPASGEGELGQPIDLIGRTTGVFQSLAAGDYGAVRAQMTYACSRVLTKRKVMDVWNAVTAASGLLEACEGATVQTADGQTALGKLAIQILLTGTVVQTTLQHEAGEWIGRVAYNGSGKITGIVIAPPDSRNLRF